MSVHSQAIEHVDILIVGAGPAGLGTALSLQHHLNSFSDESPPAKVLICDALQQGQNESRAYITHSQTLEELHTIGCADRLLPLGIKTQAFRLQSLTDHDADAALLVEFEADFLIGKTSFPFGLTIAQHVTEGELSKILVERIEKESSATFDFARGMKMIGIQESVHGQKQGFLATFENGRVIWTQYLVGADGSKSMVRTASHIPFADPNPSSVASLSKVQEHFCIADVTIKETDLESTRPQLLDTTTMTFTPKGHFLFSPMRNTDTSVHSGPVQYRLSFVVPEDQMPVASLAFARKSVKDFNEEIRDGENGIRAPLNWEKFQAHQSAVDYLQEKVDNGFRYTPSFSYPFPLIYTEDPSVSISKPHSNIPNVDKVLWASIHRVRYAIADTYHKPYPSPSLHPEDEGHVVLVGDAAHVHSPFGGQGMNLGIKDGLRCGRALAAHWRSTHQFPSSSSPSSESIPIGATPNSSPSPLQKYSHTQRAEAILTIEYTKAFSRTATLKSGTVRGYMRDWYYWLAGKFSSVRRDWIWDVSGLGMPDV